MIKPEEVYRIGRLGKPHGVKGEITMQVDDDVFDRVDAEFLVLRVDGILVPFYMEEYRFRTDTTALIKFEDVDTVEQARQLTNCDVFFLRRMADNNEEDLTWAFFVGFDLVEATTAHTVGRIAAVDDSTQNILFELDDGTLVPAAEELITNIDQENKQIYMALPEGLLNL
jgi:16S rRNA processing protein RimM